MLSPKMKGLVKLAIKLTVAVGSFALLFNIIKWKDLADALASIPQHWPWFMLAVFMHVPGYILQGLRWGGLLRAQGLHARFASLMESYLQATFFNLFLPGGFGGDAVRAYDTGFRDKQGKGAEATAVVLVDRLSGLVVMMLLAVVGIVISWRSMGESKSVAVVTVIGFFGVLAGVIVMLRPAIAKWMLNHVRGRGAVGAKVHKVLEKVYNALIVYADKRGALMTAMFWGLLHAVNVVFHYFILAKALGVQVALGDIWGFFIAVPIIQVVQALPISVGGHGTGDLAHAMLAPLFQTTKAKADGIRWAFFGTVAPWALLGGLMFLVRMIRGRAMFGAAPGPAPEPNAETTFGVTETLHESSREEA